MSLPKRFVAEGWLQRHQSSRSAEITLQQYLQEYFALKSSGCDLFVLLEQAPNETLTLALTLDLTLAAALAASRTGRFSVEHP